MDIGKTRIQWLGHASFRITGNRVIYTDPYQIKNPGKADIILISHSHFDHFSPKDINKIQGEDTVVVLPGDCQGKVRGDVRTVKPGNKINVKGVEIEAVYAYNIDKPFHPKSDNCLGYVFSTGDKIIYFAGDTDRIPEMKNIKADIALLPVSGTYVMTADEAAVAALDINPKTAIPMHYGTLAGSPSDAERFKKLLDGKINTVITNSE